jgi:hypothetical protein
MLWLRMIESGKTDVSLMYQFQRFKHVDTVRAKHEVAFPELAWKGFFLYNELA